jgi:hypothetical protein
MFLKQNMKIILKNFSLAFPILIAGSLAYSQELPVAASPQRDNEELIKIQTLDRQDALSTTLPWDALQINAAKRRSDVLALLANNKIQTPYDYWRAAMVFQHSSKSGDIRLAHSFATIAYTLHPSSDTKSLIALTWDRLLNSMGRPQWYGTQSIPSADGKYWVLADIEEGAVSDEERQEYIHMKLADIPRSKPRDKKPGQPDSLPDGYFSGIYKEKQIRAQ